MTDVSFIATGWIGTAVAVAAYAISVRRRTRRAHVAASAVEVTTR